MNRARRRNSILVALVPVIFLALLTGFFLTLQHNLEPPQEAVSAVGFSLMRRNDLAIRRRTNH
jgi:uncharacterized protein YpmB